MDQGLMIIGLILFMVAISYWESLRNKAQITEHLQAKGASDIVIVWNWLSGDRGGQSFDVEYIDQRGDYCQTRCRARSYVWGDGEIYWRDPPNR